jgi:hypothetical protein
MTNGKRLVTASFALAYLIPAAGNVLFGDKIVTIYRVAPLTIYAVLYLTAVFVAFLALSAVKARFFPRIDSCRVQGALERQGTGYLRRRLLIAIAALLLAGTYFVSGLNSYRYTAGGISEVKSLLVLVGAIANVVITVDLFYWMFVRSDVPGFLTRRYLEGVLLSLSLILSANGTASMMLALVALVYSLSPIAFKRLVFVSRPFRFARRMRTTVAALMILAVLFPIAWLSGETIKASSTGDIGAIDSATIVFDRIRSDDQFVNNYLYYFVESISSYYYSFLFTVEARREELLHDDISPLMWPVWTFAFRLDYLLGGWYGVERPEVGSLSRLNYILLTKGEQSARAGTSPGLVASFMYVFGLPLSIGLCALYLRWVARATDILVWRHHNATLSAFGALLFLLFVYDVFQSPFDLLIVFDNSVLYRLLLLGLVLAQPIKQQRLAATEPLVAARPGSRIAPGVQIRTIGPALTWRVHASERSGLE